LSTFPLAKSFFIPPVEQGVAFVTNKATAPFTQGSRCFYLSFSVKSDIMSAIFICCGQTASQDLQPIQADGLLSSGSDEISRDTRKLGPL